MKSKKFNAPIYARLVYLLLGLSAISVRASPPRDLEDFQAWFLKEFRREGAPAILERVIRNPNQGKLDSFYDSFLPQLSAYRRFQVEAVPALGPDSLHQIQGRKVRFFPTPDRVYQVTAQRESTVAPDAPPIRLQIWFGVVQRADGIWICGLQFDDA